MLNVYLWPLITALFCLDCRVYYYADDTQLILRLEGSTQSYHNAQNILNFISKWMSSTFLKLNPDRPLPTPPASVSYLTMAVSRCPAWGARDHRVLVF